MCKSKIILVLNHAMKMAGGSGGIVAPFLISALDASEWSASTASSLTKQPLVPIVHQAGWTPGLVWMLWRREQSLTPSRNGILNPQVTGSHPNHYTDSYPSSNNYTRDSFKLLLHFICSYECIKFRLKLHTYKLSPSSQ